jgi:hypothetical protein
MRTKRGQSSDAVTACLSPTASALRTPRILGYHRKSDRQGKGVERDYAEAMKWYRKGADAGDATGLNQAGWLIENGWGTTRDYAEATRWFQKAAAGLQHRGYDERRRALPGRPQCGTGLCRSDEEVFRKPRQPAPRRA